MRQKFFTLKPERELKLHVNEAVVSLMHRHIVYLLLRLLAPGILLIASLGMALFRAIGGQFFVGDAVVEGQPGPFDIGLMVTLAILAVGAALSRRHRGAMLSLLGLAGVVAGWLVFRLRGGRVLWIDPYAGQTFDPANLMLLSTAAITAAICYYIYLDWKTDELILTNNRVIYNRERPLVRREQEQIPLVNIQQVEASTDSYIQHWLSLGTLQIKSAAVGFMIFFEDAHNPDTMQRKIMEQVRRARREQTDADLRRVLAATMEGKPAEQTQREIEVERTVAPGLLQWLFPINPEIDYERNTYTWRPHWFFLFRAIWLPLTLWTITAGVATTGLITYAVGGPIAAGVLIAATLCFGGWAAWKVEDHRNDRYIVTSTQVIDLSKRPLGPESRRTANLDVLQNVTYKTNLIGRILGYGDVLLQTAGSGEDFTFFDAPRPGQMVDVITNYQMAYKRSSRIRSLEDTVKLIQYYDAQYRAQAEEPKAREVGGS